jgi:hypothetical protein
MKCTYFIINLKLFRLLLYVIVSLPSGVFLVFLFQLIYSYAAVGLE